MPHPAYQRKPLRLGPELERSAREAGWFGRQVHVVFGGTGAVGGATVLELISMLEEQLEQAGHGAADDPPRILVTGRSPAELRSFTSLLFQVQERDHGSLPEQLEGRGYRTVGGVHVELDTFGIDPSVPELAGFASMSAGDQERAISAFLSTSGLGQDSSEQERAAALAEAVRGRVGRPFSSFTERIAASVPGGRVRSVVVGIPMASVATYKLADIEQAGARLGVGHGTSEMSELKDRYLEAMVDDLGHVQRELAAEVLIAHTTAVGGMFDIDREGRRTIRLGFAHSAKGELLAGKQERAITLTRLYAERGIKMLITAAAIGIDAILEREKIPLNGRIKQLMDKARADGHELYEGGRQGSVRVVQPARLKLTGETPDPVRFESGGALLPRWTIRSGENGYFSIPNADALYRVMKVTSSSELGHVLARVGLLGDDPGAPFFEDSICYYAETDNSRQVFDLLADPRLLADQLSGLEPKALQDLGSAKHQGELHLLGLLILLHRLRTLEVDRIPRDRQLSPEDAAAFFETHSAVLTLERAASWEPSQLATDLGRLVAAGEPAQLHPLLTQSPMEADADYLEPVLGEVLRAVHQIPSLGTPILYSDEDGVERVLAGPFVSPLDDLLVRRDSIERLIETEARSAPAGTPIELVREFVIAGFGFCDLRPGATLVTTRTVESDLGRHVERFATPDALGERLAALPRYEYVATSGLAALHLRLAELARLDAGFDLRLGSANGARASLHRDASGRALLVPGIIETARMANRGQEKTTGCERLDRFA